MNFIVLNLPQVRVLLQAVEKIDDALVNNHYYKGKTEFSRINLGEDLLLSIFDRFMNVDIRKFFLPTKKKASQLKRNDQLVSALRVHVLNGECLCSSS